MTDIRDEVRDELTAALDLHWMDYNAEMQTATCSCGAPFFGHVAAARQPEGTVMSEPRSEWTVERGDGWVSATRTRPEVRVLTESKSCHIHYWYDDDEMDAQGWGMADLVCHGCQTARRIIYPALADEQAADEPLRPIREAFVHDHRQHWALGNEMLCPPAYRVDETRDLRQPEGQ